MRAMDHEGTRYRVVLTKADTVASVDDAKQAIVNTAFLTHKHMACDPVVSLVSSKFDFGVHELRRYMAQLLAERRALADLQLPPP